MDITLIQGSAFTLPTAQRASAIVFGGSQNLATWPGSPVDRELVGLYGPTLPQSLAGERSKLPSGQLEMGQVVRIHPGKLHCDFMVWAATRGAEENGYQGKAAGAEIITKAVLEALSFASQRTAVRLAISPIGAGRDELSESERLVLIVKACQQFEDQGYEGFKSSQLDEVVICSTSYQAITAARASVKNVRTVMTALAKPEPKPKAKAASKASSGKAAPKAKGIVLDPAQIASARSRGEMWDRSRRYGAGEWFVHSKFGAGKVLETLIGDFMKVAFEDGETREMIHNRKV